ncbi:MAG TPA: YsnF/AvaK domain-containing protein [Bryobacteraceae bacterium]|nr:YsnF/AvaK domain-containing protein [Bryobacteraceae bacterium]
MSKQLRSFPLILETGERAEVLSTSRFLDDNNDRVVRLQDGREILVPKTALEAQSDGSFRLRLNPAELERITGGRRQAPPQSATNQTRASVPESLPSSSDSPGQIERTRTGPAGRQEEPLVIPVIEEELQVGKHEVETGRVRVHKRVETRNAFIEDHLLSRHYDVDRVTIDQIISEPLEPRYEGDTLILPVFEEVLVVEKRLVLREEIRITRRTSERLDEQNIPVRREVVDVERT